MVPTCCIKCKKNLKMHITTAFNVPNVYNKTSFCISSCLFIWDTIIKGIYPCIVSYFYVQKFVTKIYREIDYKENMIYEPSANNRNFSKRKWKRTLRNYFKNGLL